MVIGYLLWFYFADLLLFRVGGWVGEIEDKVHLSPAEAEIGAELGKMPASNQQPTTDIKFTLTGMTNKSTNWCWEKLARIKRLKNLNINIGMKKDSFFFVPRSSPLPKSKIFNEIVQVT